MSCLRPLAISGQKILRLKAQDDTHFVGYFSSVVCFQNTVILSEAQLSRRIFPPIEGKAPLHELSADTGHIGAKDPSPGGSGRHPLRGSLSPCEKNLCVDDFNAFSVFQRVVLIFHSCIIDLFITSFLLKIPEQDVFLTEFIHRRVIWLFKHR